MNEYREFEDPDLFDQTIKTAHIHDGYRVEAGYITPEWRLFIIRMKHAVIPIFGLILAFAFGTASFEYYPNIQWGERLVVLAICTVGGFGISKIVNEALVVAGGGYFLAIGGNKKLRVTITPEKIVFGNRLCPTSISRKTSLIFQSSEHKKAQQEAREEQRLGEQIPPVYREAMQIWLQHGEKRFELASIADKDRALQITERLMAVTVKVRQA